MSGGPNYNVKLAISVSVGITLKKNCLLSFERLLIRAGNLKESLKFVYLALKHYLSSKSN